MGRTVSYGHREDYVSACIERHMSSLKVLRGTRGTARLCDTCASAMIIRGPAESQEAVQCNAFEGPLPTYPVVECNHYTKRNEPSLFDMRQTAWILETKQGGRQIGFKPFKDWERENPRTELLPDHGL